MSGPFTTLEALDIPGLDDSLACVDGACTVPTAPNAAPAMASVSAEGVGEELAFGVAEGDAGDGAQRRG